MHLLWLTRKIPPTPPSPFTSAYAAHPVKGRFALRFTSPYDLLPLLRHSLLTMAAPGKFFTQVLHSVALPQAISKSPSNLPTIATSLFFHQDILHDYMQP